MSEKKVLLLISDFPADLVFTQALCKEADLEMLKAANLADGAEIIASGRPSVIFVDTSSEALYVEWEKTIQEKIGLYSDLVNPNAIHFLSSENLDKVQYLVQSPLFGNFVLRNYGTDPSASASHYARIVKASLAERAFGLELLLKPKTRIQVVKLKVSSQKQNAVEAVKNYLITAKYQSRMATVVANAVDELLMNAIFDAPIDQLGRQLYSATSRATEIQLNEKSEVELHVGFDGVYVGITAVDRFGSIDKMKLLSHISKIYSDEEYRVKTSVAGAGIGLATVFRSGGSFFFVSEGRSRTEVTVFFRKTENYREFKDQFRFISTQFYF